MLSHVDSDPSDCSICFSVHGSFQTRILQVLCPSLQGIFRPGKGGRSVHERRLEDLHSHVLHYKQTLLLSHRGRSLKTRTSSIKTCEDIKTYDDNENY